MVGQAANTTSSLSRRSVHFGVFVFFILTSRAGEEVDSGKQALEVGRGTKGKPTFIQWWVGAHCISKMRSPPPKVIVVSIDLSM